LVIFMYYIMMHGNMSIKLHIQLAYMFVF